MNKIEQFKEKKIIPVVLCAGKGTRFGKITRKVPKSLIKIKSLDNVTIIGHSIRNLSIFHLYKIIIITGFLNAKIELYLTKLIKENEFLKDKLIVIHSNNDYQKGALYSLFSITKYKRFYNKGNILLVLPGDTIFEIGLLKEIFKIINENYDLLINNPCIFYQIIQPTILYRASKDLQSVISIIETSPDSKFLRKIKKIRLNSVPKEGLLKLSIPILVMNSHFLDTLLKLSQINPVEEIKEIINIYLEQDKNFLAYQVNSKHNFYDIDTPADLDYFNQLNKEKKGGQ